MLEDGHRLRQDHRHGDADRLAGAEQGHLSAGQRFSKNVLVVAPGLTVRNRLEVLVPGTPETTTKNSRSFRSALKTSSGKGKCRVLVRNWHALDWETRRADQQEAQRGQARREERRGLCPRGARRDGTPRENILVINDEAHHAWRVPAESENGRHDQGRT